MFSDLLQRFLRSILSGSVWFDGTLAAFLHGVIRVTWTWQDYIGVLMGHLGFGV